MSARSIRFRCLAMLALGVLSAVAPCAAAVDTEDAAGGVNPPVLEEVRVTAQRREQALVDVPFAVTAVEGIRLQELGALDLSDLEKLSPNTSIEPARGTNNALAAYIRGVGQQDHIAGFEPGVGLYVDDVYYARPQAALLDLYDVERIEVLRGPQGTLYGRNTVGGAIRYVTRRLPDAAGWGVLARAGSHGRADVAVDGAVPIGAAWRVGGAVASFNLDGYGRNLHQPGERNYEKRVLVGRGSAEWTPAPDWRVRFAGDRLQDDSDLRRGHRLYAGRESGLSPPDDVFDSLAGNAMPAADAEAHGYSVTVERSVDPATTVRAIFASRADETWKPVDLDGLPSVDVDVSTLDRNRQQSLELQGVLQRGPVDVVAGVFALDATAETVLDAVLGTIGQRLGLPGLANQLQARIETRSWAAYADATLALGEHWALSLGARYTNDRRGARILRETQLGGVSPIFGGVGSTVAISSDFTGSERYSRTTPRLALQWRPAGPHRLYLAYAEGFKAGGFDPRGLTSFAPDFDGDGAVSGAEIHRFMRFDPEQVSSIEAGWKTALGERVGSRLALFHARYDDVQIAGAKAVDRDGDGAAEQWVGATTNAASATLRGAEWEGDALLATGFAHPASRLDLAWAVGFIDGGFDAYVNAQGLDVASSSTLANTPRWTAAVSTRYEMPLSLLRRAGTLAALATWSWRDRQTQSEKSLPGFDQGAYSLWDAGISWTDREGSWRLALQGRNLADTRHVVSGLDITLGLEGNDTVYYGAPRQYWLELTRRFR